MLIKLRITTNNNSRLTRWTLALQPYNFDVTYKPGKEHTNTDGLSRQADSVEPAKKEGWGEFRDFNLGLVTETSALTCHPNLDDLAKLGTAGNKYLNTCIVRHVDY